MLLCVCELLTYDYYYYYYSYAMLKVYIPFSKCLYCANARLKTAIQSEGSSLETVVYAWGELFTLLCPGYIAEQYKISAC